MDIQVLVAREQWCTTLGPPFSLFAGQSVLSHNHDRLGFEICYFLVIWKGYFPDIPVPGFLTWVDCYNFFFQEISLRQSNAVASFDWKSKKYQTNIQRVIHVVSSYQLLWVSGIPLIECIVVERISVLEKTRILFLIRSSLFKLPPRMNKEYVLWLQ